ncbi:ribosome biogenesis GTPase Der [Candidatus Peregrinibacteria bacterium]|nr:ribosome biogenesis GTPase Der [Candidatus Peregrinibacteria bacterium]
MQNSLKTSSRKEYHIALFKPIATMYWLIFKHMSAKTTTTIAIIGRPNVGKSSLFNRLIGKKYAVTSDIAGTTRDRLFHNYDCQGYNTILIDTGGLEYQKKENIEADVQSQARLALNEADIIIFVVDNMEELTKNDFTAADILRKSRKEILLVANKCENLDKKEETYHYYELGFDKPILISAIHNKGITELEEAIAKKLKKLKISKRKQKSDSALCNICIIGKPNAGKSSLVNALFGAEKVIVSDIPGTTRDTIDTEITYNEKRYNLIDTAGLRRRGHIEQGIEKYSSLRGISAIERSDVVALLIDGEAGISKQDCHIAEFALEEKKGLLLVINKIDLFKEGEEKRNELIWNLKYKFAFVPWAPVIFISTKNKKNIREILTLSEKIMGERKKRIPTPELNKFLQKIMMRHKPASTNIKKPKFMYGSQVDINPPKFLLFFKNAKNLHFSYPRYLENEIRKEYGFNGTAINLSFRNQVSKYSQN